jgi:uncharacterized membrane protein YeaQ/YmgE (transglycosylase-associated protein family)
MARALTVTRAHAEERHDRCTHTPHQPDPEHHMGILIALVIGLVVGALARLIMPGRDPAGFVVTALLGVAGSLVAFLIGRAVGWYGEGSEGPGIIASVIGALAVLAGYRALVRDHRV